MRQVSVVMSVYKETIQEVKTALRSIQNQTYPEFEFIIVLDNPEYESMWRFLKDQAVLDDRIRLIRNHKNIGLAMKKNIRVSLKNKAKSYLRSGRNLHLPE